jgi:biotin operon repressor
MDEVIRAIEAVLAERTDTGPTGKASLWDLFALDPHNGGVGKRSDRGECLSRLNAKTLTKLRDWLKANEEEAVEKGYKPVRFKVLLTEVSLHARLGSLPAGETLFCGERDPTLPLEAVAYTRSGRAINLATIIRLERLCRKPGFMSERDLEEEIGIPRSTIRRIIERMEEIGFSLDRFTSEELGYVAVGKKRGSKRRA